jgi:hypothetical protein
MAEMTVIFEGMEVTARTAEDLIELAKARRALANGHAEEEAEDGEYTLADFIESLPDGVKNGLRQIADNGGSMDASDLRQYSRVGTNSHLGARFTSQLVRLANGAEFDPDSILVRFRHDRTGEWIYGIPVESIEEVREGLER